MKALYDVRLANKQLQRSPSAPASTGWVQHERRLGVQVPPKPVRLPKSCRFGEDQDQVMVRRVGKQVILEPADEWPPELLLLGFPRP
jgi:hypothetical protein